MKRFLAVLALVAVAGATYAATAPGGSLRAGPTAKQFAALKKQVAGLSKQLKALKKDEGQVKTLAGNEAVVLACIVHHTDPVAEFGEGNGFASTYGYVWQDPGYNNGQPWLSTALDLTDSTDTNAMWFLEVDPSCASAINGGGSLRHLSALLRAR